MAIVVIAEKPSVANDIAKVLGVSGKKDTHWESPDIVITWAVGHLLELKTPEEYDDELKDWRKSIDRLPFIPSDFELKPIGGRGSNKKQLTAIKKLIKDKSCTEVVNACDAAREGELIFRRIIEFAKINVHQSRMWLQSMTPDSILKAWENREEASNYSDLRDAAVSRAEADWIIGMNGSRIASTFLRSGRRDSTSMSLGRVQTATLAIIVDKEIDVLSHEPKPFWELEGTFSAGESTWTARWERANNKEDKNDELTKAHRITSSAEKSMLEDLLKDNTGFTINQNHKDSIDYPPLSFDLTSLQREANSLWSWTSKDTLSVAQELYDTHKLTTYPRTDSRHLPEDMIETIGKTITQLGAQKEYSEHTKRLKDNGLQNVKKIFDDSKVSDHYAIIPTGKLPQGNLNSRASKLYDLICRQFLASFHPKAVWDVQTRIASKQGQNFYKEVRIIKDAGWRAVRPKSNKIPENWENLPTPPCEGHIDHHQFKEEKTKPPARLKEARLLSLMENAGKAIDDEELAQAMKGKGLGTPATRADTIEKLLSRGFIQRAKSGSLRATPGGIKLIEILRGIPVEWITSAELTGDMESKLSSVQKGQYTRNEYMNLIKTYAEELVSKIKNHDRNELFNDKESVGNCPICESKLNETVMSYICEKNEGKDVGCSFVMWKNSNGRWFDRKTASRLLQSKTIEDLHGFFSRIGEPYSTGVTISEKGTVELLSGGESTSSEDDVEVSSCPKCDHGTIRMSQTMYACDNQDCSFKGLNKEMCKRDISIDEAKKIFTEGKSDLIDDFISRKGRPFSAYLMVEGNRVKFDFPPRGAPAGAKKFEVVGGIVAICPKTKAEIVETESFFQPKEAGTGCKIQISREMSGREITREEAKLLIEGKEIGPYDDFVSKRTGNSFSAILYMKKNNSVGYKFGKK